MIEALFLDRDGIINEIVMRDDIVGSPRSLEELEIKEEFSLLYQKITSINIPLLVVSNQPDVRRNLMSQVNLDSITQHLLKQFPKLEFSYCLHDDRDLCSCRKPLPGLIIYWLEKYDLQSENCVLIGDSYKDIKAGNSAGVKTVFLRTSYNRTQNCNPQFEVSKLSEVLSILK